jgi:tetratricopeptide (TPR) repeat protein
MRRIMEETQAVIRTFARGARGRMMLVLCEPENSPLFIKSIDAVEQEPDSPDVFVTFGQDFTTEEEFITAALNVLARQRQKLSEELAKEGRPALPAYPEATGSPRQRFLQAIEYARRIVPARSGMVWVVYPLGVSDPLAYLEFVTWLREAIRQPGLSGTRVIARDGEKAPMVRPAMEKLPGVTIYEPHLDLASLEKRMADQVDDPATPVEEQAQLHMILAGMDVASGRYGQALQRNLELANYFHATDHKHLESITLCNIGDILYLKRNYAEAQRWYERATWLSAGLESEPMVMYQSIDLGNALLMQGKPEEALERYKIAEQLARARTAIPYQVQALERIADAQAQAGRREEAEATLRSAMELCDKTSYEDGKRVTAGAMGRLGVS